MGIGGISIWQLLIILVIVLLLFGTKKLGSIGSDLGSAIRGFKKSVKDDESDKKDAAAEGDDATDTAPGAGSEQREADQDDRKA